ncbi:hypothetical protein ACFL2H_07170 [Planctomycetota bacterium]
MPIAAVAAVIVSYGIRERQMFQDMEAAGVEISCWDDGISRFFGSPFDRVRTVEGDVTVFPHLAKLSRLETVVMTDPSDDAVALLSRCTDLKDLTIDGGRTVSSTTFFSIARTLTLDRVVLGRESQHLVGAVSAHKTLRELSIYRADITSISQLESLKELRELNLPALAINTSEVDTSRLKGLTNLQRLAVTISEVRDEHLGFTRDLESLEKVDVSDCRHISDDFLSSLGDCRLKYLNIGVLTSGKNKISDSGLSFLAKSHGTLEVLNIYGTAITKESIAALSEFTSLRELHVEKSVLTTREATQLLPSVKCFVY